jgi:hypothetical protein
MNTNAKETRQDFATLGCEWWAQVGKRGGLTGVFFFLTLLEKP